MKLHEKSRPHVLLACMNPNCKVVTFILGESCPQCGELGILVRQADWPEPVDKGSHRHADDAPSL